MRVVTLRINDQEMSGRDDQNILHVAREHGIEIPTLCQLDGISDWGGCRLCLVEVKNSPKLVPACVTNVHEGMEITTDSPRLAGYRKTIVEMLFTEGNHICSVCVSNNNCELQDTAHDLKVDHITLPYRYPQRSVDASHDRFVFDANRCILCTRCVRVCDEVEGAHTWDIAGRGIKSQLISDLHQPWGDSPSCTSCGKCVQVCPTGALYEKGKAAGEMEKNPEFLVYLAEMKEDKK
ncbi:MAG: bidirectional hydrogenase complex protein HoxU [Cyanobacteria bacterium SZAS LIN-3]|nr:bidirectional hydrogenase complex protein HoxU [Cyanobacteria bacterium SZAS LIN-3]MBS2009276.1 bidirectional hydrogenase complex protein HoxU [Cyanobacteria bacterium SZAS TMP-1]